MRINDWVLIGGTRRNPPEAIVHADQLEDEKKNCWTTYLIFRGTLAECEAALIEELATHAARE